MDLQAFKVGNGGGLVEQVADIGDVAEGACGSDVGFSAMDDVVLNCEIVVKARLLGGGALDEAVDQSAEGVELTGVNFEVRMKADDFGGTDGLPNVYVAVTAIASILATASSVSIITRQMISSLARST